MKSRKQQNPGGGGAVISKGKSQNEKWPAVLDSNRPRLDQEVDISHLEQLPVPFYLCSIPTASTVSTHLLMDALAILSKAGVHHSRTCLFMDISFHFSWVNS